MVTVAGLCIAVSLSSPGFRPDNTSLETTAALGALGITVAPCVPCGEDCGRRGPPRRFCVIRKRRPGHDTVPDDSPPLAVWRGRAHGLDVRLSDPSWGGSRHGQRAMAP